MPLLATLGGTALALFLAAGLGLALGRAATQWFGGRGFSNLLMDVRGALLPFLVAPLLVDRTKMSEWIVIGLVVGVSQAIFVSRWIARRSGEWSPALAGEIALGRSGAALVTRRAAARGAVTATLATTLVQVLTLESLLALVKQQPQAKSVGGWIVQSSHGTWPAAALAIAIGLLVLEALAARLLKSKAG